MKYTADWNSLNSRPVPEWFSDAKFGVFIHWGLYSVPSWAPKGYYAEWYWNWIRGEGDEPFRQEARQFHEKHYAGPYEDFAELWKAELWQPKQWGELLEASGARYVVPVAKHHDGFALWPSSHASGAYKRPWNASEVGPMRDIIGELASEVKSRGIHLGLYYSLLEWFHPEWDEKAPENFIDDHIHPQLKDLVDRYEPELIWVDGEWVANDQQWRSEELLAWMFNHQKVGESMVVNDRWSSGERSHIMAGYLTTEYGAGLEGSTHPWEQCRGIGKSFGFNRNEVLDDYLSSRELVWMLCDYVAKGGNFLLNIGPTADGRIPTLQEERLRAIGAWLKVNGEAIYGTRPWKSHCQWSAGTFPHEACKDDSAMNSVLHDYDINQALGLASDEQGVAKKQVLYTRKENKLYAMFPELPTESFLLRGVQSSAEVKWLGSEFQVISKQATEGLWITFSSCTPAQLPCEHIWVLEIIVD